jgi:hypothetical protein
MALFQHLFRPLPRIVVALLAMAALASPAAAQPGGTFNITELESRLRQGDRVSITGPGIGTVRGRLLALEPDRLTVDSDAGVRHITADQVDRIKRTRFGVLLGTIIGAGVGVAFAIPLNMLIHAEGGDALGDTTKLLALTTGIGFGIDAAVNIPRTVYRRDARPRVQVAPLVGADGAGLGVRLSF